MAGLLESELAAWIAPRLGDDFGAVTTHVPSGFESYARIFHPIDVGGREATTWSALARRNGRVMHPTAQFHAIVRSDETGNSQSAAPARGALPPAQVNRLTATLRRHTANPEDCVFAFWDGWGDRSRATSITIYRDGTPHVRVPESLAPEATTPPPVGKLTLPYRQYALFRGGLELAGWFGDWPTENWFIARSPNLMWPTDKTWLVASEIDFDSTLVGGSSDLIEDVIDTEGLEVTQVQPNDVLHSEGDTINR